MDEKDFFGNFGNIRILPSHIVDYPSMIHHVGDKYTEPDYMNEWMETLSEIRVKSNAISNIEKIKNEDDLYEIYKLIGDKIKVKIREEKLKKLNEED
jgi:hypothetical protein